MTLFMQWTGQADVRQASAEDIAWSKTGDKFLMFGVGLLLVALVRALCGQRHRQAIHPGRARHHPQLGAVGDVPGDCMATSVFFSFDSFFTSIFPQSERVRAAELRAQNQVAGIVADIEQTIAARRATLAETLFTTEAWTGYEANLDNIAQGRGAVRGRHRALRQRSDRSSAAAPSRSSRSAWLRRNRVRPVWLAARSR